MTFEDDFPILSQFPTDHKKPGFSVREGFTKLYGERAIQNHCLDRQRVRDAIDRLVVRKRDHKIAMTDAMSLGINEGIEQSMIQLLDDLDFE